MTPEKLLEISNNWCSNKSGYDFKKNQIVDYNWLNQKNLNKTVDRLERHIKPGGEYEKKEIFSFNNRSIVCIYDYLDINNNELWELKCTKKLEDTHILQTAIYAYCYLSRRNYIINTRNITYKEGDEISFYNNTNNIIIGIIDWIYVDKIRLRVKVNKTKHIITKNNILENITHKIKKTIKKKKILRSSEVLVLFSKCLN